MRLANTPVRSVHLVSIVIQRHLLLVKVSSNLSIVPQDIIARRTHRPLDSLLANLVRTAAGKV